MKPDIGRHGCVLDTTSSSPGGFMGWSDSVFTGQSTDRLHDLCFDRLLDAMEKES